MKWAKEFSPIRLHVRREILPRFGFIADLGRVVLAENRGVMRVVLELQQVA